MRQWLALIICCTTVLATTFCFAQNSGYSSVVIGQNAAGEPIILAVIPLKYLDPVVAAQILIALGYPNAVVVPTGPGYLLPYRGGEAPGAFGQIAPRGRVPYPVHSNASRYSYPGLDYYR